MPTFTTKSKSLVNKDNQLHNQNTGNFSTAIYSGFNSLYEFHKNHNFQALSAETIHDETLKHCQI